MTLSRPSLWNSGRSLHERRAATSSPSPSRSGRRRCHEIATARRRCYEIATASDSTTGDGGDHRSVEERTDTTATLSNAPSIFRRRNLRFSILYFLENIGFSILSWWRGVVFSGAASRDSGNLNRHPRSRRPHLRFFCCRRPRRRRDQNCREEQLRNASNSGNACAISGM